MTVTTQKKFTLYKPPCTCGNMLISHSPQKILFYVGTDIKA